MFPACVSGAVKKFSLSASPADKMCASYGDFVKSAAPVVSAFALVEAGMREASG